MLRDRLMSVISVHRLLEVIRSFDAVGGASLGLVAWEVDSPESTVAEAWQRAQSAGLLEPAGHDPVHNEDLYRLSAAGWAEIGASQAQDRRRHDAIARLGVLDRTGDPALSALTRIASYITGASSTSVNILDEGYQIRIAAVNAPLGKDPAHNNICRHVVDTGEAIGPSNVAEDPRFAELPFRRAADPVRFYVSVPLRSSEDDVVIGTLCAWDTTMRELPEAQFALFADVARQVISQIEFSQLAVELDHLASHDQLTGAVNRHQVRERIEAAMIQGQDADHDLVVAAVDIDEFRSVNHRYGYGTGDEVLSVLARRLTGVIGASDTLARLGSDEFLLITTPARSPDNERDLLERIEQAIAHPIPLSDIELKVSASVGVTTAIQDDSAMRVLERAERAIPRAGRSLGPR